MAEQRAIERREAILSRARGRYAGVPAGVSLADELIAHRREESRREQGVREAPTQ